MIADSRVPNGIGILPLQHEDYDKQGFSVDGRSSIVAVRINGRDDQEEGLGQWFYDTNTPGTLEGGNFWDVDRNARACPGWAFAWPAMLLLSGSNNVATGGGAGGNRAGQALAQPIGGGNAPDGRYIPKAVVFNIPLGKPSKDPKSPAANPPPQQGGQQNGVLFLGIGASATRQGFGGPGVGPGSGFATFQGVRTHFGGSSFPSVSHPPGFGSGRS